MSENFEGTNNQKELQSFSPANGSTISDMNRTGWNPLLAIQTIRNTMNELMSDIFYQAGKPPFDVPWHPEIDMHADGQKLTVEVSLAGGTKDDIQIHATTDLLIIQGEIKEQLKSAEVKYFFHEMKKGRFSRSIPLPFKVIPDQIKANLKEGLLTITIPLLGEQSPTSIKIDIE